MSQCHIWGEPVLNSICWNLHNVEDRNVGSYFIYLSVHLVLHGWGKVPCLSVKSDFCAFLIMERDIWDGETKSCLCLGPVDPAVSPEESQVQCEGEQVPGGYVRDCPWALPMAPSYCSFKER